MPVLTGSLADASMARGAILGEELEKSREIVPDPARQQKAREYSRLLRRGSLIELGIGAILLLVLLLTPASTTLASLLASLG